MPKVRRGLEFLIGGVIGFGLAAMPESAFIPENYNYYIKPMIPAALIGWESLDSGNSKKYVSVSILFGYSGAMIGQILYPYLSPYV